MATARGNHSLSQRGSRQPARADGSRLASLAAGQHQRPETFGSRESCLTNEERRDAEEETSVIRRLRMLLLLGPRAARFDGPVVVIVELHTAKKQLLSSTFFFFLFVTSMDLYIGRY